MRGDAGGGAVSLPDSWRYARKRESERGEGLVSLAFLIGGERWRKQN